MSTQVKIGRLQDGRVGVTLSGESGGFYAWSDKDAVYIAVAMMRFFETEKQPTPEPAPEYEDMEPPDPDNPVDVA